MNIIEFPGLWGLKLTINNVAFEVFDLPVYWYGIIIAFAFMLAVLMGMRDSRKFDLDPDTIVDMVLITAPVAVVCARLYYVAFKWENYKGDLLGIINIRQGGLAIYGGIIGAFITVFIFAKVKKIPFLKLFDFGVPYVALAQAIGRWGNFVNQEAFGTNTSLPWGMTSDRIKMDLLYLKEQGMSVDPNIPVHPTFLYESLWNLATFFFLIYFRKRKKHQGEVFFLYMVLYGIGRAWIEGLRTDSLMLGNLRISQVLAFAFAVVFAAVFFIKRKKQDELGIENTELGSSNYGEILLKLKEEEEDGMAIHEITDEEHESAEQTKVGSANNESDGTSDVYQQDEISEVHEEEMGNQEEDKSSLN